MSTISQTLAASDLFRGLTSAQCEPFVPLAHERVLHGDETVFRLGDDADALFIIRRGVIQLTVPISMHGHDSDVTVQEVSEGETVAWSALIEPYRFTMSARADGDVELLVFSPRALRTAVAANPDAGVLIMTNLARVIAQRLQLMHAMWAREFQRTVNEAFG